MKAATWILRLLLAAVFAAAAVSKLAEPHEFHAAILTYRLLPEPLVPAIALWLPWVELCGAVALFFPRHRPAALWLLFALTAVFLLALGQAAGRGIDIVCGCFGRPATVRGAAYLEYLVRDVALLAVIVWLLWRERRMGRMVAP